MGSAPSSHDGSVRYTRSVQSASHSRPTSPACTTCTTSGRCTSDDRGTSDSVPSGLGPIGDGVTTVALVVPFAEARRGERFFDELNRFPGVAGRFDPRRMVRRVLATGPFARWSRRPVTSGALLVGDAADFFDPFTGQGIYSALRGAELAAAAILDMLATGASLQPYARARRREFAGKWLLERMIGIAVGWPALIERVVGRLLRRPELADLLVRATGNCIPARAALTPAVLAGLVL